MLYFDQLQVQNFRRLRDLKLELRPLSVLIGANGSGKSSVLDVLDLLSSSASDSKSNGLTSAINRLGGISAIQTFDHPGDLTVRVTKPPADDQALHYCLSLAASGTTHAITLESLDLRSSMGGNSNWINSQAGKPEYLDATNGKMVSPTWPYNPLESALSQVPRMYSFPEGFRSWLNSSVCYRGLEIGPHSLITLPQPLSPARLPGIFGEDLVSCLFNMRETAPEHFEAVDNALHAAFPSFERLGFLPVAAGLLAMTWRDANFSRPFYVNQLSKGTLRFLWLVALLQSPALPSITLIDEPEVSLHPQMLAILVELFREASTRTQLIVATHSDRLVRFLQPNEIIALDVAEDGSSSATWADQLDLASWLEDYSLDELWSMGRLGGRA